MEQIKAIEKEMETIGNEMMEYYIYATPAYNGEDKEEKSDYYYDLKRQYESLRKQLNNAYDEMPKQEQIVSETFVNGYGEATKREITSASYKRSQKRLEKQLLSFVG